MRKVSSKSIGIILLLLGSLWLCNWLVLLQGVVKVERSKKKNVKNAKNPRRQGSSSLVEDSRTSVVSPAI